MTCSIEELTNTRCKWPIGDPKHKNFCFCGEQALEEDSAYCPEHKRMAHRENYVPQNQRNKKAA